MSAKSFPIRGGFPVAPDHLNDVGKSAWESGKQFWLDGRIDESKLVDWLLYAEAVQEKAHCEVILTKDGEYSVAMNGCFVQHPALKRRQQAESVMRKTLALIRKGGHSVKQQSGGVPARRR